MKPAPAALLGATLLVTSLHASADDKLECIAAADRGQAARDAGHLQQAQAEFLACAREVCPSLVRTDCATWHADVSARLPSVVLVARDAQGRDLPDARVRIDGAGARAIEASSITLDPGEHVFRFERGSAVVEQAVVLREGEKGRRVEARLAASAEATPAGARAPLRETKGETTADLPPPAFFVFLGLGIVGGAGYALFGLRAKGQVDDLRSTCAPRCDPADVDAARREMIIANVSFGVALAGLAGAAWFAFAPRRTSPRSTTSAPRPVLGAGGL